MEEEISWLKADNEQLNIKTRNLESKLEANKVFTFMIIHDLKHPTESIIETTKLLKTNLETQIN